RPPLGGGGDLVLLVCLEGGQDPQDLVDAAAVGERVVDHRPHHALVVDDEHAADGRGAGRARVDHPVRLGHLRVQVGDHGELDLDPEVLLDVPNPGDVGVDAVD